jgi:phenylpropionate dioxygenase-like ring-hydroxylating dioxygenase large terminal subunit
MGSQQAEERRARSYPGAQHPAGWYHVLDGADLAPGRVRHVQALGEDLALLRGDDGQVSALAFPPPVRTRTWPVHEAYGMVFVYHGADGEPPYRPDLWPELQTERYRHLGRHAPRDVAMHLLEFAENTVDPQHFDVLHSRMMFPWTRRAVPGVALQHRASWQVDADRPWICHFHDDAVVLFRGRPVPRSAGHGHALFLGPASVVAFRISIPPGDVVIFQTHTPQGAPGDPLRLRVRFSWWAERAVPRVLAWYVVGNWVSQWWQDLEIWERKVHVPKPALSSADGPVHELRRWFRQFQLDAVGGA